MSKDAINVRQSSDIRGGRDEIVAHEGTCDTIDCSSEADEKVR